MIAVHKNSQKNQQDLFFFQIFCTLLLYGLNLILHDRNFTNKIFGDYKKRS